MKIKRLILRNFRQFFDECQIDFSFDDERKVTLIHAENGVGKTTILYAIHWCLYKQGIETSEGEIIPHEAIRRNLSGFESSVTVRLEYDGKDYDVERRYMGGNRTELTMFEKTSTGESKVISPPEVMIDRILPRDLYRFFFFEGESLMKKEEVRTGRANIKPAIKEILGLVNIESAVERLKKFKQKIDSEKNALLREQSSLEEAVKALVILDEKIEANTRDLAAAQDERARAAKAEEDAIQKIMDSNHLEAKSIEDRIKSKNQILIRIKNEYTSLENSSKTLIGAYGHHIYSNRVACDGGAYIEEQRRVGRIPAQYSEKLIEDLIEHEECICGRSLVPGSKEYDAVLSRKETATTTELSDRVDEARSYSSFSSARSKEFLERYRTIHEKMHALDVEIEKINSEIRALSMRRDAIDDSDVAMLNEQRKTASKVKSDAQDRVDRLQRLLDMDKASRRDQSKIVDKNASSDPRIQRLSRYSNFVHALIKRGQDRIAEHEALAKQDVFESVNHVFENLSRKPYRVEMDDDFNVRVVTHVGTTAKISSGENVLLNISFVSSLINFCRKRTDLPSSFLSEGTVAPFVIDAPFGHLDPSYMKVVSEFLLSQGEQLGLMLSKTQWTRDVDDILRPYIGDEYVLVNKNFQDNEMGVRPSDEITISGKTYYMTLYGADGHYTEVEPVYT